MQEVLDMLPDDVEEAKEFAESGNVLKGIKGYIDSVFEAV